MHRPARREGGPAGPLNQDSVHGMVRRAHPGLIGTAGRSARGVGGGVSMPAKGEAPPAQDLWAVSRLFGCCVHRPPIVPHACAYALLTFLRKAAGTRNARDFRAVISSDDRKRRLPGGGGENCTPTVQGGGELVQPVVLLSLRSPFSHQLPFDFTRGPGARQ